MIDQAMKKTRPQSIIWFERTYWLSFAAFLLDEIFSLFDGVPTLGPFIIFEIAFTALLWYLIAVKAKDWARWLYIVFTAGSVVMMLMLMVQEKSLFVYTPWSFVFIIASVIAAGFLFRIDAILWCVRSDSTDLS